MAQLLVVATTADLDARDLVRAIERAAPPGVAVAAAPGLLAPAADGALHRDAARARGAVVCVLAPGGPDLANHALLTVEAARAAGLAVAAVIVAGPGGAEQRAALRAHAHAEVVELADLRAPSAEVAAWPLADWAVAEPLGAGGAVALAPYRAWEEQPVPDPRTAGRAVIDPVLLAIVEDEGPVLATRAYRLYVKASGGKALTSIARAPLSGSAYRLRQEGRVEISPAAENPGQDDEVLRPAGSPPVRVRELGPRALDEVPLAEVAALMDRLRAAGTGEDDLARAVLDTYGLVRMTAKAEAYLALARAWGAPPV
jgi:hypothetical protein